MKIADFFKLKDMTFGLMIFFDLFFGAMKQNTEDIDFLHNKLINALKIEHKRTPVCLALNEINR